jgi:hypothetical protein
MPRRSLERIALARLLVGGCVVVFGACALIEQALAEHGGGGGGIPVRIFIRSSPCDASTEIQSPPACTTPA